MLPIVTTLGSTPPPGVIGGLTVRNFPGGAGFRLSA